jgi:hypothetical protein
MRKQRLTPAQLYWLGRLTGHYVNNDGSSPGSRGHAVWTVNPGRTDGAEYTLETLHRRGLVIWVSVTRTPGGAGFAITEAGLEQWLAHFPDQPLLTSGQSQVITPQPTPAEPGESPTYVPPRPKVRHVTLPTLTAEEWAMIAERFAGANDPVGQSIHTKAEARR